MSAYKIEGPLFHNVTCKDKTLLSKSKTQWKFPFVFPFSCWFSLLTLVCINFHKGFSYTHSLFFNSYTHNYYLFYPIFTQFHFISIFLLYSHTATSIITLVFQSSLYLFFECYPDLDCWNKNRIFCLHTKFSLDYVLWIMMYILLCPGNQVRMVEGENCRVILPDRHCTDIQVCDDTCKKMIEGPVTRGHCQFDKCVCKFC